MNPLAVAPLPRPTLQPHARATAAALGAMLLWSGAAHAQAFALAAAGSDGSPSVGVDPLSGSVFRVTAGVGAPGPRLALHTTASPAPARVVASASASPPSTPPRTSPAPLDVPTPTPSPSCTADFDKNGLADLEDLSEYIACFFSPAAGREKDLDLDRDGEIDADDLAEFMAAFFGGCD